MNKKIEAQIEEHCQHDNMVNIYLGKVVVPYVFLSLYIRCFLNLGPKALDIGSFILAPKLISGICGVLELSNEKKKAE